MQASLVAEVSIEEIIRTHKSFPHNKSPGPDGYTVEFFLATWNTVRYLFTAVVKEFFASGKLSRQLNTIALTLVPKIPRPSRVTNFRPIACCNIVYKCISKVLSKRLKKVLPHIISNNQSVFIEGK